MYEAKQIYVTWSMSSAISIGNHTHSSPIGNNCIEQKLKLYAAEPGMDFSSVYTACTIIPQITEFLFTHGLCNATLTAREQ